MKNTSGEKIRSILNNPEEPGLKNIANFKDYEREIIEGVTMEVTKYGNKLDEYCPHKQGQLTCIVGHPNIGKTTFELFLLSKIAKKQKKILVYSAENPIRIVHREFTRFFMNVSNVEMEHLEHTRKIIRYIKHERRYSYKDLLLQATYLLDAGYDFDEFFIDPYNSLMVDRTNRLPMHEYHQEAIEEMRIFTQSTGKGLTVNCHTVTEAQRVKLDSNGCRPAPHMSDVEGGGKFSNKPDDVMVFHRQINSNIPDEKYTTEVHVGKVRNQEFGGSQTPKDNPIKFKMRLDRTGFDDLYSYEQKINDYKSITFSESKKSDDVF